VILQIPLGHQVTAGNAAMMHTYAKSACIVSASKADLTRYWAVASSPQQAIVAAQLILGHEWTVTLANPRLKPSCLERLKLRTDEMRELSVLP
jgi:hypothetical protein